MDVYSHNITIVQLFFDSIKTRFITPYLLHNSRGRTIFSTIGLHMYTFLVRTKKSHVRLYGVFTPNVVSKMAAYQIEI